MPKYVLLTDRAWPQMIEVAREFAMSITDFDIKVIFLTSKYKSKEIDNFHIFNIFDIPQKLKLSELQEKYEFSLHKCFITERAFYDYSSFRRSQCYSSLSPSEIEGWAELYANAFDYIFANYAHLYLDTAADCFIPSLGGRIASHYHVPCRIIYFLYWWSSGAFFCDRLDWTSSKIDEAYSRFLGNLNSTDKKELDLIYAQKKSYFLIPNHKFSLRLRQLFNRQRSYEPISLINWIVRRISRAFSSFGIRRFINRGIGNFSDKFILFPLHVTPEASLLGTVPELADQFSLIKNISMNLPYGVKLYVKEHPHSLLGDGLDFFFYKRISSLPNVVIIKAEANLDELFNRDNFIAVVGISGTVCLDAALKRKHAILFGSPLFKVADCFHKPANFDEFQKIVMALMRGQIQFNEEALYAVLKAMDHSLTEAGVDLSNCKSQYELASCYMTIYKYFIIDFFKIEKF